jgi:lysophospholipase L1-like esterase
MSRALAVLLAPIVLAQATRLRRATPLLPEPPGPRTGGKGTVRLVVVGDSTAVGTGVENLEESLPAQLGAMLGARWRVVGKNGANAADLLRDHIGEAAGGPADVAVLVVGWNDAMHLRSERVFARDLRQLFTRLRAASPGGRIVLVAPPAFGAFAVLPRPLKDALAAHAAGLGRVSARIVAEFDATLAPGFDGASVASDHFHPDADGYRTMATGIVRALSSSRGHP